MADPVIAAMKCSKVVNYFNATNGHEMRSIMSFVNSTWETLDDKHMEAGDPGIMPLMTHKVRLNNEFIVPAWRQKHPKKSLLAASEETYQGLREMQIEIGQDVVRKP